MHQSSYNSNSSDNKCLTELHPLKCAASHLPETEFKGKPWLERETMAYPEILSGRISHTGSPMHTGSTVHTEAFWYKEKHSWRHLPMNERITHALLLRSLRPKDQMHAAAKQAYVVAFCHRMSVDGARSQEANSLAMRTTSHITCTTRSGNQTEAMVVPTTRALILAKPLER
jgi:hypothetical protein